MIKQLYFHCKGSHVLAKSILDDMLHKQKNEKASSGDILVLFTPYIGDTILYLNVLREIANYYHAQKKRCSIVTIKQDCTIIQRYCDYDEIIIFNFAAFIMEKNYREKVKEKLHQVTYEKIINPYFDSMLNADFVALITNGKEKISADRKKPYPGKIFRKSLLQNGVRKRAYDRLVYSDASNMDFIKQSSFMKELGIYDFRAKISYMEETNTNGKIPVDSFAVIAPGASKPGKCWEPEKFAFIIKNIVSNHNMDIYICGGKNEEPICEKIIASLDRETKENVINNMGKTSLLEYFELIRKATIVISNDSSPVHIAASVGTPCVCIIGGWDYHRLLPYEVETMDDHTKLPVPIYSEVQSCFNCFDHHVAYQNAACKKCIKMQMPYPCISAIGVTEVEEAVEQILNDQEGGR